MAISTSIVLKFSGAQVQRGLASIRSGFANLNRAGGGFLTSMISKTAKWGALIGAVGLAKIGVDAVKAASSMETLQTQFAALLKSGDAATSFIEKLRKLNIESPLGLDDFAKGAKQLLGVRMTAEESADALDKLSNISMGNADSFESLVRAFSQVRSAGRLMGQEVLQFVNAGFNPLAEISQKTGESMRDLKKRMEDGAISFSEVAGAITHATAKGGLFNGMNQKIAATTEGKLNKLKDSWNQLLIAFGTPINDHLRPLIDELGGKFSALQGKSKAMGETVGESITMMVNAFGNGELGTVIKDSFMLAVKAAGAELMALATLAGEHFYRATKGQIGKDAAGMIENYTPFGIAAKQIRGSSFQDAEMFKTKYEPGAYQDNRKAAYELVGFDTAKRAFDETLKRNQTPLVDYSQNPTKMAEYGKAAEWMRQAVAELKMVNQKLSPQP